MSELETFDWVGHTGPTNPDKWVPNYPFSIMQAETIAETSFERKKRMLIPLAQACVACSMCELGLKIAYRGNIGRDPHVLSNMNPKRFAIYGQNPGYTELEQREPFVGEAGRNFEIEIAKHGLVRDDFYIGNVVRCFTAGNIKPAAANVERCQPFLQIELNLIKPLLVITLGAVAFDQFCPGIEFSGALKTITKSERFRVPVFALYHPSPLNLKEESRSVAFAEQIKVMCGLVKALRVKHGL